jgi:AraC-like DNA-binding protein
VKDGPAQFRHATLAPALEAVGEFAGLNNRITFLNAFKKFTGVTPSQYLKSVQDKKTE